MYAGGELFLCAWPLRLLRRLSDRSRDVARPWGTHILQPNQDWLGFPNVFD
ncbi:hypothetical protein RHCRD62_90127 [Rhodococcus sp. RD6.2]|nr:hypothetical protein RHCRD62_90127 [Rhodococcus sp. RD6.2]